MLITLFVQVIAVTLLPAALVFLILLLNDEETMGKYKNTLVPERRQHRHYSDDHRRFHSVWDQRAVSEHFEMSPEESG